MINKVHSKVLDKEESANSLASSILVYW
jgi:hypothetical protein